MSFVYKIEIEGNIYSLNCSDEIKREIRILKENYKEVVTVGNEKNDSTFIYFLSENPLTKEDLGLKTLEVLAFGLLNDSEQHQDSK